MIGLGLRLTLAGGRPAVVRLLLMASGVAIGAALLCAAATLPVGFIRESERAVRDSPETHDQSAPHLLWAVSHFDVPGGRDVTSIAVAQKDPKAPRPLGARRVPAPGTVLVSPALARALADPSARNEVPPLPGRVVGRLDDEALRSPDELVFMTGWEYDALRVASPGAVQVTGFNKVEGWAGLGVGLAAIGAVFTVVVFTPVLLAPVLVFLGSTARVGARRREQRLAAMRLVGATPGQVRVAAAVEAAIAGLFGALAGVALAFGAREVLARRGDLFASDFTPPLVALAVIVALMPVLAGLSAVVALHRVEMTPLGVTRRRRTRPVKATRWVPLAIGWALIAAGVIASEAASALLITFGIVVTLVGLVRAGPWLLQRLAGWVGRTARRPAALLAARRIEADPRAGFRPGAAVALSLFAATLIVTIVSSTDVRRERSKRAPGSTVVAGPDVVVRGSSSFFGPEGTSPSIVPKLRAVPGVTGVVPVYADVDVVGPQQIPVRGRVVVADCPTFASVLHASASGCRAGVLIPGSSNALALNLTFRAVDGRAFPVTVPVSGRLSLLDDDRLAETQGGDSGWQVSGLTALVPPALVPAEALAQGEVTDVLLRTDGSQATARRMVGLLAAEAPGLDARPRIRRAAPVLPNYRRDLRPQLFGSLAFIFLVAGCSLAVTTVDAMFERRRPLATLRAAGVTTATLRHATTLEIAAPLLAAAALGVVNGLGAGMLFSRALDAPVTVPLVDLLVMPALVVVAWLGVTAVAVASMSRASSTESLRTA